MKATNERYASFFCVRVGVEPHLFLKPLQERVGIAPVLRRSLFERLGQIAQIRTYALNALSPSAPYEHASGSPTVAPINRDA